MGTPDFARMPLERLYGDGHEIAGVFTQPDKPQNRGMKIRTGPVKELALSRGTPVFQPATLRDGAVVDVLRELNCDLIVVVAYGKLLPKDVLDIPPIGCVNVHASLLPKYRGAAPIQWAVINGERETGITTMFMAEELDAGDMIFSESTPIGEDETSGELHDRLSGMGARLLSMTVKAISRNAAEGVPQNHSEATFAPPLTKEMSAIDWSETAHSIKCKVRGLNPWPVATAEINNALYKVYSVDIADTKTAHKPGEIVSSGKRGLEIACADGSVIIKELQAPGGKRMPASDYLRGHPI